MASATLAKQANALITKFINIYEDKYGRKPSINRYKEKYGFQDMISDLGYDKAGVIVEYYFKTTNHGHPVSGLLYNYDKINEAYEERQKDNERRKQLRKETEQMMKEWELGKRRDKGNFSTNEE